MKKTLTVNLGGTVFHIDEDAYRLLDEYLSSLTYYFRKEEGGNEIIKDIEVRISELFNERIQLGYQVITLEDVQEVISRIGKPEEFSEEEEKEEKEDKKTKENYYQQEEFETTKKKFYRDTDDKILGGVAAGFASYMGWDVTLVRLILILILFFTQFSISIVYLICWLVIPPANTIAEKLAMRGKKINMENIGQTLTDNFEKVSEKVNQQFSSPKTQNTLKRVGDTIVNVIGAILKVLLIIITVLFSPVLFILGIVFLALIIVALCLAFGGGAILYNSLPYVDWSSYMSSPLEMVLLSFAGVFVVGIPLIGIIYAVLGSLLNWKPMTTGMKYTMIIVWIVSFIVGVVIYWNTGLLPGFHAISDLNLPAQNYYSDFMPFLYWNFILN